MQHTVHWQVYEGQKQKKNMINVTKLKKKERGTDISISTTVFLTEMFILIMWFVDYVGVMLLMCCCWCAVVRVLCFCRRDALRIQRERERMEKEQAAQVCIYIQDVFTEYRTIYIAVTVFSCTHIQYLYIECRL